MLQKGVVGKVSIQSGIWMTMFGLLMWDIIFADIPDVFLTRFQVKEFANFSSCHLLPFASVLALAVSHCGGYELAMLTPYSIYTNACYVESIGMNAWLSIYGDTSPLDKWYPMLAPLDLDTDSFYITRKSLIEDHLQKIHEGMAEEIIIGSWDSHMGTACLGVNWDRHCLSDLRAAVACVGGPCLASLCRHLAQDYRNWSSGLPDLLLWRFSGEYNGEAKLVEVKGPRDRLSEQQRAWLLTLMDCGFNVEVCKVSPTPADT